jgi:hypothetical protein
MLGAVGCVVPEWGYATEPGLNWINVQAKIFSPEGLNYLDNPSLIHAQSPVATVAVLAVIMGLAESYRSNGAGGPIEEGLDKLHPGGPFDPLGLADDPDTFAELKVKEIKNGMRPSRLAPATRLPRALCLPLTQPCPSCARPPGYVLHAGLLRAGHRHRRGARGQPERSPGGPGREQRLRVRAEVRAAVNSRCQAAVLAWRARTTILSLVKPVLAA